MKDRLLNFYEVFRQVTPGTSKDALTDACQHGNQVDAVELYLHRTLSSMPVMRRIDADGKGILDEEAIARWLIGWAAYAAVFIAKSRKPISETFSVCVDPVDLLTIFSRLFAELVPVMGLDVLLGSLREVIKNEKKFDFGERFLQPKFVIPNSVPVAVPEVTRSELTELLNAVAGWLKSQPDEKTLTIKIYTDELPVNLKNLMGRLSTIRKSEISEFLLPAEAAERIGVHKQAIFEAIKRKSIPTYHLASGRVVLYWPDCVNRWPQGGYDKPGGPKKLRTK